MKKFFTVILCVLFAFSLLSFAACKDEPAQTENVTITFVQQGQENVVISLKKGESLINVPDPVDTLGYDVSWDIEKFSNLQQDLTVTAVLTPKTYQIILGEKLSSKGFKVNIPVESISVKYMESLADKLPANPTCSKYGETFEFLYWADQDGNKFEKENYDIAGDVNLFAIFDIEYV